METIKLNYEIPDTKDPKIFGPPTWNALHDLVDKIPCSICKDEASSFMVFFHDLKNYQLGKSVQDKKNFMFWIKNISKLKNQTLILK